MILLDTDHVNVLKYPEHPRFVSLTTQLNTSADQDIATTVITLEEQMRGWLAWINRRFSQTEIYSHWRTSFRRDSWSSQAPM